MSSRLDRTVDDDLIDRRGGAQAPEIARLEKRCRQLEAAVRRSERDRRQAIERMLRAEEQERRRLAAELHDDTVQVLTACLVALDRLGQTVESAERERIAAVVAATRRTLAAATERTRGLMFELRPTSLREEGLGGALRDLAEQARDEAGLAVDISVVDERFPYLVEEIAYRTVREAMVNVRKHARATTLEVVAFLRDGRLCGRVADNGRGFEVAGALDRSRRLRRMGLDAMRERLELAGGSVDVRSAPGAGTTVSFELPLDVL